ncbi:MAG: hypothetical protein ABJA62_04620 [Luteimonas sp.]
MVNFFGMTLRSAFLPSFSFFENRLPVLQADPKGGAQDVRRFPTEPWMASRKIPMTTKNHDCRVGESPFFWLLFFGLSKEK